MLPVALSLFVIGGHPQLSEAAALLRQHSQTLLAAPAYQKVPPVAMRYSIWLLVSFCSQSRDGGRESRERGQSNLVRSLHIQTREMVGRVESVEQGSLVRIGIMM